MSLLEEVRVIDLTGPSGVFATRLLADLGADVVRVEPSDGGELRRFGPFVNGEPGVEHSYHHQYHNANKRSVVLDLADAGDRTTFDRLLATADILVESGEPGHLDALGLDYGSLKECCPQLVYVSVSPFGQDGPWSARKGNDLIGAASGGILGISGSPDDPPMQGNGDPSWKMAGLLAATGALIGWFGAVKTGRGAWIDISVQEATTMMVVQALNPCIYTLQGKVPRRKGFMGPIHRCADGRYVSARATPNSLPRLQQYAREKGLEIAEGEEGISGAGIMAEFARTMTAHEMMDLVVDQDLVGLPVGRFEDMAKEEHFIATRQFFEVESTALGRKLPFVRSPVAGVAGDRPIHAAPALGADTDEVLRDLDGHRRAPRGAENFDPSMPLEGLRVLDFSWVLAGPFGTRILANFGAEVVRVESAARLDNVRRNGESVNTSGLFNDANAAKQSITLDMTKPESVDIVKRLAAEFDVVTNNFRAGVLDRMGLGYEVLKEINPNIVVVHLPGCGTDGPWANRPTFGGILMAASGMNEISGFEGRPPYGISCAYPDFTSPYLLAMQVIAAVHDSRKTGQGREIVIDQLSAMISLVGLEWMRHGCEGELPRNANRNDNFCPHGVYPVAGDDEWCAIAVEGDEAFERLCQAMGRRELADDPRFATLDDRKRHEDALDEIIGEWTSEQDGWALADSLQAQAIAAAKVESLDEMIERDPQLSHRQHYQKVRQPTEPDVELTLDREAIQFVGIDRRIHRAPALGEHNEKLLGQAPLAFSGEEIEALKEAGVVR